MSSQQNKVQVRIKIDYTVVVSQ